MVAVSGSAFALPAASHSAATTLATAPVAAFTTSPSPIYPNADITLDGSGSSHPDRTRAIVTYEWDFHYDLALGFRTEAQGRVVTIVGGFAVVGPRAVALRVTDDTPPALGGPLSSIATQQLTVAPPVNRTPVANAGGPYLGTHGVPVQLDASASFDPDGDALTFAWDFQNNGSFTGANGPTASVTFSQPDVHPVAVRVTDSHLASMTAYTTVEVGNHPPRANAGGPYIAQPGQTIMLDGAGSSDPDGDALTYAWDLRNNRLFNDSTSQQASFTVPASSVAGSVLPVCVKVKDGFGGRDTACSSVTVVVRHTPPTVIITSPSVRPGPLPVTVTLDGSQTSDANGDPLTFTWTSDGGSVADPGNATTNITFTQYGSYTAHLAVSNGFFTSSADAHVSIVDMTRRSCRFPLTWCSKPTRTPRHR